MLFKMFFNKATKNGERVAADPAATPDRLAERLDGRIVALQLQLRRNAGYLARREIEELKVKMASDPRRLEPFGYKVYSQNDEDGIIEEIFRRLGIAAGTFCEIGVENGLECNTLYLLHKGWRGAWMEGNTSHAKAIERKFGHILRNKRLALGVGFVTPDNIEATLQAVLEPMGIDVQTLDFLSIDIDGMDIYLFEALKIRPKVLCIEYNAKFPPHINKRPIFDPDYHWAGGDYMGSSLLAIDEAGKRKGYTLVATNLVGANAFLVRNDLLADHFAHGLSVAELYNPPRYYLYYDHYSHAAGHAPDFGPYADLVDKIEGS